MAMSKPVNTEQLLHSYIKREKNLAVYTALFGNYDRLIDPAKKYADCDFICFTDQKDMKSKIWNIKYINDDSLSSHMMNRRYKLFPHLFFKEYTYSLYIDSNIKIKNNPLELVNKYLSEFDMAVPIHFARNCVYKESEEVIHTGKAKEEDVKKQMSAYHADGFPQNFGLTENSILLRKHHQEDIIKLMESWWNQLHIFTQRDQLSLMYLIWKFQINIAQMEESARGSIYFQLELHQKEISSCRFYNRVLHYYYNHPQNKRVVPVLRHAKAWCQRFGL